MFTRTKFGANNVAEFLTKNGISAMALHGNKSQAARTQALAGFKSGDIRALVATDIAARGIDIDDLPHVVNYEIPNVSEDYVHRIGRTGRAGADGAAVNLVCLDEEGFMQDIERFTKQNIEVKVIEGFGPEARREGRAHRHGPPDHLGRRGQTAEPRRDAGSRQGRAHRNAATHARKQGGPGRARRKAAVAAASAAPSRRSPRASATAMARGRATAVGRRCSPGSKPSGTGPADPRPRAAPRQRCAAARGRSQ